MTFICEGCAEGMSPERADAEATYPDSELGGSDGEGGHLCRTCAAEFEQRAETAGPRLLSE